MQKIWFIAFSIFLFLTQSVLGQSARLEGLVVDQTSQQALEFATISLHLSGDSSLVNGVVSGPDGRFAFEKLREGEYYLLVRFLGYDARTVAGVTLARNQRLVLPATGLLASQKLLDEIVVQGEKAAVYHKIDKQVYRAGQFQASQGGTATDVIKNLPSVSVNGQGEISMRGSTGFLVLLNGKPVQGDPATLLSQLPANAIENVEIITAPSARYDADGKAGIINITTKTGAADGLSLVVNAVAGLPSVEDYDNQEKPRRYGGDFTLNYKKGKWDLSAGGSYNRNDNAGRRVGEVNTTIGNRFTSFPSVGERSFDKYNYSARAALVFTPNPRNSFRGGFYHGIRTEYRLADIGYTNTATDLTTGNVTGQLSYFNSNLVKKRGRFSIGNLDYSHTFANKSTLSVSGLFEHDQLSGFTKNANLRSVESTDTLQYTLNTNRRPLTGSRLKADYVRNLGSGKLESGYQYRQHQDEGDFAYLQKEGNYEPFTYYPGFSGEVRVKNVIHAVYSQYSGQYGKKLSYVGGLRYEHADRQLTLGPASRPFLLRLRNFFPSANALYQLSDHWQLKAGYSRRVQRTTSFELNPLPEREHSETLEQGDPNLLPEFVSLSELGVVGNLAGGSVFATAYYQGIKNVVNRVNSVYADTVLNRIYTNAGRARRIGLEAGLDVKPLSWWSLYLGGNVYDYQITGSLFNNSVTVNNGSLVYSLNVNTSFRISPTVQLQANFNYLSRRATAQGEDSRFYSPNLSLRKTFLDGKLAATLQWQHVDLGLLQSNEQRITTRGRDFYTTTNYIYEVDVFMLNLSYTLNQPARKVKFTESEFGEKEF